MSTKAAPLTIIGGVAYSSGYDRIDPLLDTDQCQIDAGLMKSLGANTIRVYTVDGTKNHDGCMQAFRSQGIYVWLDLPNPVESINHVSPPGIAVVDEYPNASVAARCRMDHGAIR